MIQSAAVIFIVVALAYIWGSRGFFSAFLHMVCVLVAGAIAFAFFEPIAYLILNNAEKQQWLVDSAWGIGLAAPFALSLVVIRLACDKIVPANCDLDGAPNLIGGILCGTVTGTIATGMLLLTISFLRLGPELAGVTPIRQESNGSPVLNDKLIYPADRMTAWLYGKASEATLKTDHPLAVWRPTITVDGALLRTNFNEGGSRHTLVPKAFSLERRFTVAKDPKNKVKVADLLSDGFAQGTPKASDLDGSDISPASTDYYLEGFVVNFRPQAREKEGNVVIGNTQIQLVCYNEEEGKSISVHPIAVSSKAEPVDADDKRIRYGRWRYERPNSYFRSVGGTDAALMGFEFLVPRGYEPIALNVKGVREDLTTMTFPNTPDYTDKKERDKAIQNGTALGGEPGVASKPLVWDRPGGTGVAIVDPTEGADNYSVTQPIRMSNSIPANRNSGTIISKDNKGALQVNEDKPPLIIGGEQKYKLSDLQKNRGIDGKLQIRAFYEGEDTRIVQVDFGKDSPFGPVQNLTAGEASGEMVLLDERGESYPCIGFVYFDSQLAHIRFTPESVVRTKEELPFGGPSTSRPDQQYVLLFRVGRGTKLKSMKIGDTTTVEIKPSLTIEK